MTHPGSHVFATTIAVVTIVVVSRACSQSLTYLWSNSSFRWSPFRNTSTCVAAEACSAHNGDGVDVADQPILDAEVVRVRGSSSKVGQCLDGAHSFVDDNATNSRRHAASSAEAFDGRRAAAGGRLGSTTAAVARGSPQATWDRFWEPAFDETGLEGRNLTGYRIFISYLLVVCSPGQTLAFF
jgi:hypothetical protein